MRRYLAPLFLFVLIGIGGCAGLPDADTPRKKLALAEVTYTVVVEKATELHDRGMLSGEAEARVDGVIIGGSLALDAAHEALAAGQVSDAERQLAILRATNETLIAILQTLTAARE